MKEFEIICRECGKVAVRRNHSAIYCEECAKVARRRRIKEHNRMVVKMSNDTAAMRTMCLNCERPRCSGHCSQLSALAREEGCNAT